MPKTKAAKAAAKTKMCVSVVLDRSGSMESTRLDTVAGFNEYLNGLRADKESDYRISLTQFDTNGAASLPELTVTFDDKPLDEVADLALKQYVPRGGTPLYDAIGECVRRTDPKGRAVIIVVITDGAENSSKEFTRDLVKNLIKSKEAEGWTFVFLGADIDSYATSSTMAFAASNTSNYTKGNESALYANLAQSTMMRSQQVRSHGVVGASMMAFFDDTQKCAMGDQTVTGVSNPSPVSTTVGGSPSVPLSFRPISVTSGFSNPTPVESKRKPRGWTVSAPGK